VQPPAARLKNKWNKKSKKRKPQNCYSALLRDKSDAFTSQPRRSNRGRSIGVLIIDAICAPCLGKLYKSPISQSGLSSISRFTFQICRTREDPKSTTAVLVDSRSLSGLLITSCATFHIRAFLSSILRHEICEGAIRAGERGVMSVRAGEGWLFFRITRLRGRHITPRIPAPYSIPSNSPILP